MKLAKREKYLILSAGCLITAFILFQLLIFPYFDNRERLKRGITAKEEGLRQIIALQVEYQTLKRNSLKIEDMLSKREKGFTLFSFLERAANEAKVKDHIKYMKPSTGKLTGSFKESMVEMKLETITMRQLVDTLFRIETSGGLIVIKRISIIGNKKKAGYLDAVFQVLTFHQA